MEDKTVYLNKVARECMSELDAIGIQYGKIQAFTVNTRAQNRWGQCRRKDGTYTINISYRLLENTVPVKYLKNTLLHEILHTCKNCMTHTGEWKNAANKVNVAYGYNIKRTTSAAEYGIQLETVQKQPKHLFKCDCCGQEIPRYRESDFTRNYTSYRCEKCKGHIIKLY